MKSLTSRLYLSGQTVFTAAEVVIFWKETNPDNLKSGLNYYCKTGVLTRLRRGIYALAGLKYMKFEVANRVFTPSYISLETVLVAEGVIFQHNEVISSVSYLAREILIDGQRYGFRRLAASVLANPMGVINKGSYSIATRERAFLDSLYLNGKPYFDRLDNVDWELCKQMVKIYDNKQLERRLLEYVKS